MASPARQATCSCQKRVGRLNQICQPSSRLPPWSGAWFEVYMVIEPEARNVEPPHENNTGFRRCVFKHIANTCGPVWLSTPSSVHGNSYHFAADLSCFIDQEVDCRTAILKEVIRVTVTRSDQITTVVKNFRVRDNQQSFAPNVYKIGNVVIAGIGII